jgi:hypothetical protein
VQGKFVEKLLRPGPACHAHPMSVPAIHPAATLRPEPTAEAVTPRASAAPQEGLARRRRALALAAEDTSERRGSGRRARARDRLMDRATQPHTPHARLAEVENVENLLLFVDDDLRETALAIHHIEAFLLRTLGLLETEDLRREHVREVAGDTSVLDHVDQLNETLESLRRRLARLAARMK